MRIAYVLDQCLPNRGADTEQAVNTIAALIRRGVGVDLHLPRPLGRPGTDPAALAAAYRIPERIPLVQRAVPLARVHAAVKILHPLRVAAAGLGGYDLVYTRDLVGLVVASLRGRRVAFESYRPWPDQLPALAPLFRRLMRRRRFVGAVLHSRLARDSFVAAGVPAERLAVIHNGHDPRQLEPRLGRAEARVRLGLPAEETLAVYAGRVNASKGLDVVLAMARLLPGVRFVLLGSEGEGEIERAARQVPNVAVRPWVPFDEVAPWLYAADVLIVPPSLSPLQGAGRTVLPLKLFRYLAAGRPILAPRAPDTAELLVDGDTARLVPPDDPAAAAAALAALLADPPLAARLAERCRALAESLTWDARAARIEAFLGGRLAAGS